MKSHSSRTIFILLITLSSFQPVSPNFSTIPQEIQLSLFQIYSIIDSSGGTTQGNDNHLIDAKLKLKLLIIILK